jgi:hypothetical protein
VAHRRPVHRAAPGGLIGVSVLCPGWVRPTSSTPSATIWDLGVHRQSRRRSRVRPRQAGGRRARHRIAGAVADGERTVLGLPHPDFVGRGALARSPKESTPDRRPVSPGMPPGQLAEEIRQA